MDNLSKDIISKIKRNIAHSNHNDIKKYGIKGTLTYEDFIGKIKEQGNKCYVCQQEFKYDGKQWCYFYPSADRIYNYSGHTKENIAASCVFCNVRMFKQVSEKKCGLCEGLNHSFEGDIITKSILFRKLGNNNYKIKEYIALLNDSQKNSPTIIYYDNLSEIQIQKDAKLLMAEMLTQKKNLFFDWRCEYCKSSTYAFTDTPSIHYKEGNTIVIDYEDISNQWVADIAILNKEEIIYIIEIKNTNRTIKERPEPWFEVDAESFIKSVNDVNTDDGLGEYINLPDFIYSLECTRTNILRYCYGSFCYKEGWVMRIPGYDTKNTDNSCILCKRLDYAPTSDGCTGKFQNGEIRVCFDCLEKDTYEKKIRNLYSFNKI